MVRTIGIGLAILLAAASGGVNAQQTKSHFGRGLDIARVDGQQVTRAKPKSRVVSGEVFVKLPGASHKVVRARALRKK